MSLNLNITKVRWVIAWPLTSPTEWNCENTIPSLQRPSPYPTAVCSHQSQLGAGLQCTIVELQHITLIQSASGAHIARIQTTHVLLTSIAMSNIKYYSSWKGNTCLSTPPSSAPTYAIQLTGCLGCIPLIKNRIDGKVSFMYNGRANNQPH